MLGIWEKTLFPLTPTVARHVKFISTASAWPDALLPRGSALTSTLADYRFTSSPKQDKIKAYVDAVAEMEGSLSSDLKRALKKGSVLSREQIFLARGK